MGPHAGFIWASYAITAAVVSALIYRAITDERRQRKALERLEAQGIRRRSDARAATGGPSA
ncbi:MAG: heme exporter protein CcmD [Rhodomicrobiaceae bacterium]